MVLPLAEPGFPYAQCSVEQDQEIDYVKPRDDSWGLSPSFAAKVCVHVKDVLHLHAKFVVVLAYESPEMALFLLLLIGRSLCDCRAATSDVLKATCRMGIGLVWGGHVPHVPSKAEFVALQGISDPAPEDPLAELVFFGLQAPDCPRTSAEPMYVRPCHCAGGALAGGGQSGSLESKETNLATKTK